MIEEVPAQSFIRLIDEHMMLMEYNTLQNWV